VCQLGSGHVGARLALRRPQAVDVGGVGALLGRRRAAAAAKAAAAAPVAAAAAEAEARRAAAAAREAAVRDEVERVLARFEVRRVGGPWWRGAAGWVRAQRVGECAAQAWRPVLLHGVPWAAHGRGVRACGPASTDVRRDVRPRPAAAPRRPTAVSRARTWWRSTACRAGGCGPSMRCGAGAAGRVGVRGRPEHNADRG
jgi:hypothetical protein